MEEWIKKWFSETWSAIDTDIVFSDYTPKSTNSSTHIYEERYEIDGKTYRLLYEIGCDNPIIEILTK